MTKYDDLLEKIEELGKRINKIEQIIKFQKLEIPLKYRHWIPENDGTFKLFKLDDIPQPEELRKVKERMKHRCIKRSTSEVS